MDQGAREDIAAAAAAHYELGREYDSAVAEGLIERIGAEIDKRVDARLDSKDRGSRRSADPAVRDKHRTYWTGVAVGAGVASIPAVIVAAHGGSANPTGLMLVTISLWIAIAVVYSIATTVRSRSHDHE